MLILNDPNKKLGAENIERPRLSTVLLKNEPRSFDSLVTLPSNVQAAEAALLFGAGRLPFVSLVGPSGWGKSHLLEASAQALRQVNRDCSPQVVNAEDWVQTAHRLDPLEPLLIDNVQEAIDQHKSRLQLRLAIERRIRAGRPTMLAFTAPKVTRAIRNFLPNHHAWVVTEIESPTATERERLVRTMSRTEGLALSESLQWLLARKLLGDGRTLIGAFQRLKLADSKWLDGAATLRALGVLTPFFADNVTWDLREIIFESAVSRCRTDWNRDLATYVMLKVALIPEAEVAQFFEVKPATAYARAVAFQKRMDQSDDIRSQTRRFIEEVVDRLRTA